VHALLPASPANTDDVASSLTHLSSRDSRQARPPPPTLEQSTDFSTAVSGRASMAHGTCRSAWCSASQVEASTLHIYLDMYIIGIVLVPTVASLPTCLRDEHEREKKKRKKQ